MEEARERNLPVDSGSFKREEKQSCFTGDSGSLCFMPKTMFSFKRIETFRYVLSGGNTFLD